jgi:hypothetical protein
MLFLMPLHCAVMNAVADTLRHGVLTAFAEDTASRGNECT